MFNTLHYIYIFEAESCSSYVVWARYTGQVSMNSWVSPLPQALGW